MNVSPCLRSSCNVSRRKRLPDGAIARRNCVHLVRFTCIYVTIISKQFGLN